jgi:hypothetical protein
VYRITHGIIYESMYYIFYSFIILWMEVFLSIFRFLFFSFTILFTKELLIILEFHVFLPLSYYFMHGIIFNYYLPIFNIDQN